MKKNTPYIISATLYLVPVVTFAAGDGVKELIASVGNVLGVMEPILLGLAVVYFFWGIGQFILHDAGSEKAREDGKRKMLWGVIAIFVFVSIHGILNWFGDVIGISTNPPVPNVTVTEDIDLGQLNP